MGFPEPAPQNILELSPAIDNGFETVSLILANGNGPHSKTSFLPTGKRTEVFDGQSAGRGETGSPMPSLLSFDHCVGFGSFDKPSAA
jgi:hypothetical protein